MVRRDYHPFWCNVQLYQQ
uniref:Uncharacterized protein n=1 Tax=Anguilla anguilla TaxID=7936 RepID=A0A0E9WKI4_ANGAN